MRIAVRPADRHLDTGPPPQDADPQVWQRWARHIADDIDLVAAVELASPPLADQLAKVVAGARLRPARYRRLSEAVLRYRSRMTRATPLGLFAGIAPARFGPEHRLPDLDTARRTLRVGTEWLNAALAVLEDTPELLRRTGMLVPVQQRASLAGRLERDLVLRLDPVSRADIEHQRGAVRQAREVVRGV